MYTSITSLFRGICDAIREKSGGIDLINHQDIPDAIRELGGGLNVQGTAVGRIYEIPRGIGISVIGTTYLPPMLNNASGRALTNIPRGIGVSVIGTTYLPPMLNTASGELVE